MKTKKQDTMQQNYDLPIYLFHKGENRRAYEFFGCHPHTQDDREGFVFRVWAPNAKSVRVIGSFCDWDTDVAPIMEKIESSQSVYACFVPNLKRYDMYQYYIEKSDGSFVYKSDPYAVHMQTQSGTASKVYDLATTQDGVVFRWHDQLYRAAQARKKILEAPLNIYEVHLGSWQAHDDGTKLDYQTLAQELIPYVKEMGYTHIELMPVAEYPFDPSWGYQGMGYFAPTSRYGTPHDFMAFVDACHQARIGVILDWVPAHFPKNENGLFQFDGECCYEYSDARKREHQEWGTCIFDFGRNEVRSFLISNVVYWLKEYHIDGIRVDAVTSMLYLDYGKQGVEWSKNQYGDRINLEAVSLLQQVNQAAVATYGPVMMIAEESTAYPLVTKPPEDGGLGFHFKWNMGWMNDTLAYMSTDPFFRKDQHHKLTFSLTYAFSENYILPLSHDEVVHGKCSMIEKMPGLYGQKFDNLRALYAYMMAHPGKKLQFMGNEFAQFIEWDYQKQLDWILLGYEKHQKLQHFVKALNYFYKSTPPLYEQDYHWEGFSWLSCDDAVQNVVGFIRSDKKGKHLVVICNFSPVAREDYRIGVPFAGSYTPVLSSDDAVFGGSGTQLETLESQPVPFHQKEQSIVLKIPPMATVFYAVTKTKIRKTPKQMERVLSSECKK